MTREQSTSRANGSVFDAPPYRRRRVRASAIYAIAALAASVLGCTAEVVDESNPNLEPIDEIVQPIQGGQIDVTDVAVVGIGVLNDSGRISKSCSGTLIAPNLVLTAQHCVATTAKSVRCDTSTFGTPVDPQRILVTVDARMWDEGTTWVGAHAVEVPPGFPAVCGRDIALIVLEQPMLVAPLSPRLDGRIGSGQSYDAIGYGKTSGDAHDGGTRRRRNGLAIACVASECGQSHVAGGEWRGDHGICSGDSGGPAIDEQGLVIGVTSRGPDGCDDPIYGGLGGWGGWITTVGQDAANYGGYPMPDWNNGAASSALSRQSVSGAGACAYRPASSSPKSGVWTVLVMMSATLLLRARLRSRQFC